MTEKPSIKSREIKVVHEIPIDRTLPFWEKLKHGKVLAAKCRNCGVLHFPPVADCPKCLASEMDWVELSGEGVIETFTYVAVRSAAFQQNPPYIVAIGRLKEGVKVLAWLKGLSPEEVKVGLKVRLVAKTSPQGNLTYEFLPFDQKQE